MDSGLFISLARKPSLANVKHIVEHEDGPYPGLYCASRNEGWKSPLKLTKTDGAALLPSSLI